MCVIMIADTKPVTEEMVQKGFDCNPAGAGIAWREEVKGKKMVRWIKGVMSLDEIQALVQRTPLPYIVHFRIPTVGGCIPELTHPFPVHPETTNALKGMTTGRVLFHNGHWRDWKQTMMESAVKGNALLPEGKWSDSRAMAWVSARHGLGMLNLIDEKTAVFGPDYLQIFGDGWEEVDEVVCSNKHWCFRGTNSSAGSRWTTPPASITPSSVSRTPITDRSVTTGDVTPLKQIGDGKPGGASQGPSFRGSGETVHGGEALPQEAKEGEEGVRDAYEGDQTTSTEVDGDLYHKITGSDRSETQQLIEEILDSRNNPAVDPAPTEAEKIWKWAAGINKPQGRSSSLIDPRVDTLESRQERDKRLAEASQGISRVIH